MFVPVLAACTAPLEAPPEQPTVDCAASVSVLERPDDLAPFEVTRVDGERSEMAGGHLLLTQRGDRSFVAVIDGRGDHVWWHAHADSRHKFLRSRLSRDGRAVLVAARRRNNGVDEGEIRRVDLETGAVVTTRALDHHHDFVERSDGTLAYLSRVRAPDTWFDGKYPLVADVVRTAPVGSEDPSEHGQIIDLLHDVGLTPWWTCSHMGPGNFLQGNLDWSHTNSLAYDDATGELTLGVRHFDGVLRLDAEGEVRWWLGGILSTLQPELGTLPLRHAHFSEVWHDGILAFDNRNHYGNTPSRIVELAIDEDRGTFREVWSYEHPDGLFFGARGDVRLLPGGNRLVAWPKLGEVWEITPDGEVVWLAETTSDVVRMEFLPTWPPFCGE